MNDVEEELRIVRLFGFASDMEVIDPRHKAHFLTFSDKHFRRQREQNVCKHAMMIIGDWKYSEQIEHLS